ncbi:ABC transporter permease [Leucobacter weissii]|uniref:ABC transporter permease n=1 Tax=Leucobacter weissii TaxID=1983706 RepID=A0A939S694_9MICO|nr:ABC transporter permease [Leucobacter weissii]MBO1902139.1 ABC transporter permease [Leucobacter weissii]
MTETVGVPPAQARPTGPGFWRGTWVIAALELRQRLRSRTLLVLAIVWFCVIGAVTLLVWGALTAMFSAFGADEDGFPLFSVIVYFVLLFGTLVAPAISAGSIGDERRQATLATTQVTLIGSWSLLLGKTLAAWITGVAFLVVAAPFVVFSLFVGQASLGQLLMALLGLVLQIGVFTVIGVGLSAMIESSVLAIVTAYLLVALLSVGTLIAFSLAAAASTRYVEVEVRTLTEEYYEATDRCYDETDDDDDECWNSVPLECETSIETMPYVGTDKLWWILALNPYVVVADLVPPSYSHGTPVDLFGNISYGVRSLQTNPDRPEGWNECSGSDAYDDAGGSGYADVMASTVPVWWIGLGLQALLVAGALWGGYRRLDTPAAKLPKGSRVA